MKSRIATFMIALFVFFAGIAFSSNTAITSDASKEVSKLLEKELNIPDYVRQNNTQCSALVRILLNDDGSLTADCVNCLNAETRRHVIEDIESIRSDDLIAYAGTELNFKITFKLV